MKADFLTKDSEMTCGKEKLVGNNGPNQYL